MIYSEWGAGVSVKPLLPPFIVETVISKIGVPLYWLDMTESKICPRCGSEKTLSEFYFPRKTKSGYSSWCKPCEIKRVKEYRRKIPKKEKREYMALYRTNVRQEFIQLLGGKCERCENDNPIVLCFHHLNPEDKEVRFFWQRPNNMRTLIKNGRIQLLCLNCHQITHSLGRNKS